MTPQLRCKTIWLPQDLFVLPLYSLSTPPCILRASQVALMVKNLPANAGDIKDVGLISRLGRSPGGGNGNPLHYSCLENSMGRGAWQATVHGVTKSQTRLK